MQPNESAFIKRDKKTTKKKKKRATILKKMENAHNESNQTTVEDSIPCSAIGLDGKQMVFLFAINLAICISAILENILILAAFRKVSSLHPPSKLLFVQLTLVVCYTPFGVERGFIATNRHVSSFAAQIAWSLVALSSALNPIIYFWKMREVRHAARKLTEQLFWP